MKIKRLHIPSPYLCFSHLTVLYQLYKDIGIGYAASCLMICHPYIPLHFVFVVKVATMPEHRYSRKLFVQEWNVKAKEVLV